MTWTVPAPDVHLGSRTDPERPMLEGYLDYQRTTLLNICAGLTAAQLAERAITPSNLSLLGLLRHLALVEQTWFRERLAGESPPPMFDPALGYDADFDDLDPAAAGAALDRLQDEWRSSREIAARYELSDTFRNHGEAMSVRMLYFHLIGEYARHNGHADLLRERLDGVTGR